MFRQMSRAQWNDEETRLLLTLCLQEKDKLNFSYLGLTNTGWSNVYTYFPHYDKKQCNNKLYALKSTYVKWKASQTATGLGREPRTGDIAAEPEYWDTQYGSQPQGEVRALTFSALHSLVPYSHVLYTGSTYSTVRFVSRIQAHQFQHVERHQSSWIYLKHCTVTVTGTQAFLCQPGGIGMQSLRQFSRLDSQPTILGLRGPLESMVQLAR